MQNKPKRRWLRFSLSTLLISVTIVCVWLGSHVSTVRERSALRESLRASGNDVYTFRQRDDFGFDFLVPHPGPDGIPYSRQLLGDEPIGIIILHNKESRMKRDRVQQVFPEARLLP
jgi:hypothetical protein